MPEPGRVNHNQGRVDAHVADRPGARARIAVVSTSSRISGLLAARRWSVTGMSSPPPGRNNPIITRTCRTRPISLQSRRGAGEGGRGDGLLLRVDLRGISDGLGVQDSYDARIQARRRPGRGRSVTRPCTAPTDDLMRESGRSERGL